MAMPTNTQKVTRPPPYLSDIQPVSERDERADQRAEESVGERIDLGELRLGEQREARRIADERAEGAGVEPAHDPVVLALEDHRLLGERGLGGGDVVHAEPGREGAGDDERHPDVAGVLQPHRHASALPP